jgi:hypothetical protein
MDISSTELLVRKYGVNTLTRKNMTARAAVTIEAKDCVYLSQQMPDGIEVRYSGTEGSEHDIARMLILSQSSLIMVDDELANDM